MNEREDGVITINIWELAKTVWHYAWLVVLFIAIGTTIAVVKVNYFTADTYTANGVIYVSSKNEAASETVNEVNKSDIDAARSLTTTYIETLKIRSFLNEVSAWNEYKYSWKEIKNMMKVESINETELLSVEITADTAEDAYLLTQSVLMLSPSTLSKVTKGGSVEVLDYAQQPSAPNDKGLIKNSVLGGILGMVLAVMLIFLITFFDTKVHKSEDVEKRYNISILGMLDN